MRCKKCKDEIILYLYGELRPEVKEGFESHIESCASCREELVYTKSIFEAIDGTKTDVPEGDWDKNWAAVKNAVSSKHSRPKASISLPRWSYAAAAIFAVFVVGFFAGRTLFKSPSAVGVPGVKKAYMQSAFDQYIDDIKPLLIDYANFSEAENGSASGLVTVDRESLRGLLVQNIILKRILAEKHPEAAQLLDDIEIVLRELENLEPDDSRTPILIKDLIKKREILFKMEILQKT